MPAVSIEVRGQSGLAANFRALDAAVKPAVQHAMQRQGGLQKERTEAECPKRTGFMASRTRLDFSPEGLTYTVGYKAEDFEAEGLPFYPPFVILGTSRMAANDFLFRVHEMMAQENTRVVGDELRRSFQRFRV